MKLNIENAPPIHYCISDGFQLLEHCLAIYEWLPGDFFVTSRKPDVFSYLKQYGYPVEIKELDAIKEYVNKDILICPSGSHGFTDLACKKTFYTTHGLSEKGYYKMNSMSHENRIPLQFARYLRGTYEFTKEQHMEFLHIDPSKWTILYAPTQGEFSSFSIGSINIFKQLAGLRNYNVIIKPHALCWHLNKAEIEYASKTFPMDIQYHNIVPFLDIGDIIIGDISASTSAAFYYAEKPVILLKNSKYEKTNTKIMTNDHVNILNQTQYGNIPGEIERCLKYPTEKESARRKYFKNWYGTIDGTEGLQYAKFLLKKLGVKFTVE